MINHFVYIHMFQIVYLWVLCQQTENNTSLFHFKKDCGGRHFFVKLTFEDVRTIYHVYIADICFEERQLYIIKVLQLQLVWYILLRHRVLYNKNCIVVQYYCLEKSTNLCTRKHYYRLNIVELGCLNHKHKTKL